MLPIIGTVSAAGIQLTEEEQRAGSEAKTVAAFLDGGPPDSFMEAMLETLGAAFDHFGLTKPQCDPAIGIGLGEYTETNLLPLFRETKMLSLDQIRKRRKRKPL